MFVLLCGTACTPFWRKKASAAPPAPPPQVTVPEAPSGKPTPPLIPPPPETPPAKLESAIEVPPPGPLPAPPNNSQRKPHRPESTPSAAGPATETSPDPPLPQLGQILTPEQRAEYNRNIDQSLHRAEKTLRVASGRTLTREQAASVAMIASFIRQAESLR
ncbi:MAG TPA: hypothetical protein VFQ79_25230, partial [Bryobacteraceae bacterium]|nr:hypothetical protein [Bryobacteraceae bacterium]